MPKRHSSVHRENSVVLRRLLTLLPSRRATANSVSTNGPWKHGRPCRATQNARFRARPPHHLVRLEAPSDGSFAARRNAESGAVLVTMTVGRRPAVLCLPPSVSLEEDVEVRLRPTALRRESSQTSPCSRRAVVRPLERVSQSRYPCVRGNIASSDGGTSRTGSGPTSSAGSWSGPVGA